MLLAFLLAASQAWAVECKFTENLPDLNEAVWTCHDEMQKLVPDLKSEDEAKRKDAARRIFEMNRQTDQMLDFLDKKKKQYDANFDAEAQKYGSYIPTARSAIVDVIRKEMGSAISQAQEIAATAGPPDDMKLLDPYADDDKTKDGSDGTLYRLLQGQKPQKGDGGLSGAVKGPGGGQAGPPGAPGSAGKSGPPPGPPGGGSTEEGFKKGGAVMSRAQGLAEGLKPAAVDDGMGSPGAKKAADSGAGKMKDADMASLAASGFSASFKEAGLKMGTGSSSGQIQRLDGSPASPADLERLRLQLAKDPEALRRRPDFFDVISRPSFERLKTDFDSRPEERDGAFRHVGMTEQDRDFLHTQTCDKNLDAGCNKLAAGPYRKGEFVSPEDLKSIDGSLHPAEEEDRDEPRDGRLEQAIESDQLKHKFYDKAGVYAKINGIIGGFRRFLFGESGEKAEAPGGAAVSAGVSRDWPSKKGEVAFTNQDKRLSATPPPPGGAAPGGGRRPWLILVAALAAGGLWLARRSSTS